MLDLVAAPILGAGSDCVVALSGSTGVKAAPARSADFVRRLLEVQCQAAAAGVAPRAFGGLFRVRVLFEDRVRQSWAFRTEVADLPWMRGAAEEPTKVEVRRLYARVARAFPYYDPDDHSANYGRLERLGGRLVLVDLGDLLYPSSASSGSPASSCSK